MKEEAAEQGEVDRDGHGNGQPAPAAAAQRPLAQHEGVVEQDGADEEERVVALAPGVEEHAGG